MYVMHSYVLNQYIEPAYHSYVPYIHFNQARKSVMNSPYTRATQEVFSYVMNNKTLSTYMLVLTYTYTLVSKTNLSQMTIHL